MKPLITRCLLTLVATAAVWAQTTHSQLPAYPYIIWQEGVADSIMLLVSGRVDMNDYSPELPGPGTIFKEHVQTLLVTEGVKSIGAYAFHGFARLTSATLAGTVERVGSHAFSDCVQLRYVRVNSLVPPAAAADAFQMIPTDATLSVPRGALSAYAAAPVWRDFARIITAHYGMTTDMIRWEYDDTTATLHLTAVLGEAYMRDYTYIAPWGELCEEVKALGLEKHSLRRIGERAFVGFVALDAVTLPDGLLHIGRKAFADCTGLRSVALPDGLKTIDSEAFARCYGLKVLTVESAIPPVAAADAFSEVPLSDVTLIVPRGALPAYAEAPVWRDFMHLTEAADSSLAEGARGYAVVGAIRCPPVVLGANLCVRPDRRPAATYAFFRSLLTTL